MTASWNFSIFVYNNTILHQKQVNFSKSHYETWHIHLKTLIILHHSHSLSLTISHVIVILYLQKITFFNFTILANHPCKSPFSQVKSGRAAAASQIHAQSRSTPAQTRASVCRWISRYVQIKISVSKSGYKGNET